MSISKAIILCLIGCGAMSAFRSCNLERDRLVGRLVLSDPDLSPAQRLTTEIAPSGPHVEAVALDDVVDGTPPDGFLIASPAACYINHLRWVAVTRSLRVLRKPVATDLADFKAMATDLDHAANRIQVAFNRRFVPHLAAFKARLAEGAIGVIELLHLHSRDHVPPSLVQLPNPAGLIAETMIHDLDTVRWLLGDETASVTCHGAALVNPDYAVHGHIDTATTVLVVRAGQQVVDQNSWRAPHGYDQRITALGPDGVLRVENPRNTTVSLAVARREFTDTINDDRSTRYPAAYQAGIATFVGAIFPNGPTSPNIHDGIAATLLAHCCQEALSKG